MIIGVKQFLEKHVPGFHNYPSLLLIEGPPGSGKTILASSICYNAMLNNQKCLYVSLVESKEKYYTFMKTIGIDLKTMEDNGLFEYVYLPISSDIEAFTNTLQNYIYDYKPFIIVIDTINSLLKALASDFEKRAYLQNFFASIPHMMNSRLILVYESEEHRIHADIEYVVDTIIKLDYKISGRVPSRIAKIVKSRGSPLHVVEFPFAIREGKGIVFIDILEFETSTFAKSGVLKIGLGEIGLDSVPRGWTILVSYPPDARIGLISKNITAAILLNKAKTLFISYKYRREDYKYVFQRVVDALGLPRDTVEDLVNKYIIYYSIDPLKYSATEIAMIECELIEELNPDIVVFHGISTFMHTADIKDYYRELVNQLRYLRTKGIVTFRVIAEESRKFYLLNSALSDIVLRFYYDNTGRLNLNVWRRDGVPMTFGSDVISKLDTKLLELLKSLTGK